MSEKNVRVEDQIKGLRRLKKNLETTKFNVVTGKAGVSIKHGMKHVIIPVLNEAWAKHIADALNNTVVNQCNTVTDVILDLEQKCEQLNLKLFGG